MIEPGQFALFMLGAITLNLIPGPDMTFVMSQGAARGTRAGVAAALGIGAGTIVHILLAAAGLAALLSQVAWAFDIIRYAGAAYLVWIAIQLFRAPPVRGTSPPVSASKAFRQGALINILNPKVALFFLAFLPQFMSPEAGPYWLQSLILGLSFNVSGTIVNLLVALSSGRLADTLRRRPRIGKYLNWFAGALMGGLAVRLLLARR
ncbi:MAG TPA: LysE family translocator [Sphingomicrobium sp.]|nr:LysE family translocator [Sphingomicrobium sp.]